MNPQQVEAVAGTRDGRSAGDHDVPCPGQPQGVDARNRAPESGRVRCPRCGAGMERHGEMLDCAADLAGPWAVDPDLGGVLLEVHWCPTCGGVMTRRRVPGPLGAERTEVCPVTSLATG